ncbi:tRNA (adenosine(37)-N6)-dimethylallyltransferase MiaA [uncultured Lentibacter sp.]|jgi:tRNA dimethylallyltransferase|uniref:tRNA (adenosine(37)-N6)-dimethylallyltransferase MiaA n=1 Tax=uncultured Lentibacter sp. TaxID=1659309 RepID=UPI00262F0CEC|nr:tRNA (adenosine(37)-N6)-dimethylallyltransferase MiaA [uncultured Lentibacter sp.]
MYDITRLSPERPVLIAGPTASGKSALALAIAEAQGGTVVNADALQVYSDWRVLTARPSPEDEARAPHALYGHVAGTHPYSVGEWLSQVRALASGGSRLIIVGGTGLYFSALTEGLAAIPPTPPEVRATADALRLAPGGLAEMIAALDAETAAKIDLQNPMRVQRAFEVLRATGRGLALWQAETPPPDLPLSRAQPLVIDAEKDWLNARISQRFDLMLKEGALAEAAANLPDWAPGKPSSKAIGAPELIAHLAGEITLKEARSRAIIASRQYAKRQRTWFRARMQNWQPIRPA